MAARESTKGGSVVKALTIHGDTLVSHSVRRRYHGNAVPPKRSAAEAARRRA